MSQKYYDMIVRDDTSRISGSIETRNYKKKKIVPTSLVVVEEGISRC